MLSEEAEKLVEMKAKGKGPSPSTPSGARRLPSILLSSLFVALGGGVITFIAVSSIFILLLLATLATVIALFLPVNCCYQLSSTPTREVHCAREWATGNRQPFNRLGCLQRCQNRGVCCLRDSSSLPSILILIYFPHQHPSSSSTSSAPASSSASYDPHPPRRYFTLTSLSSSASPSLVRL